MGKGDNTGRKKEIVWSEEGWKRDEDLTMGAKACRENAVKSTRKFVSLNPIEKNTTQR